MPLERPAQLAIVLVLEAAVGYPAGLYERVAHPVVWIGRAIAALDVRWNAGESFRRRLLGCMLVAVLVSGAATIGILLERAGAAWPLAMAATLLVATTMLAQRSLHDHVTAVLRPLQAGDLPASRAAASRIVGRDTDVLDEQGVATAAVESLAESFCDGIVAPAFWFLVAGLPGLLICKAINTGDSMVGHKDNRYRAFGWAVARADDLINLIPARLAGLLICLAGCGGLRTMLRDARLHASPNGGWPEAAMAGVLTCRLGGPVSYEGEPAHRAILGAGPRPDVESLRTALAVYRRACLLLWIGVAGVAWLR